MPSTVIASYDYEPSTETLTIKFVSGLIYAYLKVPEEIFQAFKNYREKGVYLNKHIKNKYDYKKIN
jgi:hypothetical protein